MTKIGFSPSAMVDLVLISGEQGMTLATLSYMDESYWKTYDGHHKTITFLLFLHIT